MNKHMITGLGPVQEDGGRELFTVRNAPYKVTRAWLEQYPAQPSVGDTIIEDDDGTLWLSAEPVDEGVIETKHYTDGTSATGVGPLPDLSPQQQAEEDAVSKKEDGSVSATGSEPEGLKTYVAKPIKVIAGKILVVGDVEPDGTRQLMLADESVRIASAAMLARITPMVGDYWVIHTQQGDTYEYLNPKEVFEAKYSLVK